jgi:hypothetical protein
MFFSPERRGLRFLFRSPADTKALLPGGCFAIFSVTRTPASAASISYIQGGVDFIFGNAVGTFRLQWPRGDPSHPAVVRIIER